MASARDCDYAVDHKLGCALSGKKHAKWSFKINGRLVGWSMRSHGLRGNDQLSARVIGDMAREMRCTRQTWQRILDCPGTLREYLDELLLAGEINQAEYQTALP